MSGYVNVIPAFVCFELLALEARSFCNFWKFTSCNLIAFISSLIDFGVFNVLIKGQNMIYVDAVDFGEWHPAEVISFFWRSVYEDTTMHLDYFVGASILTCNVYLY